MNGEKIIDIIKEVAENDPHFKSTSVSRYSYSYIGKNKEGLDSFKATEIVFLLEDSPNLWRNKIPVRLYLRYCDKTHLNIDNFYFIKLIVYCKGNTTAQDLNRLQEALYKKGFE